MASVSCLFDKNPVLPMRKFRLSHLKFLSTRSTDLFASIVYVYSTYICTYWIPDTNPLSVAAYMYYIYIVCSAIESLAHPSQLILIKLTEAISRIAVAMVTVSSHAEASGCVCVGGERKNYVE